MRKLIEKHVIKQTHKNAPWIENSFNLIEDDVLKIKSYKHLLKRIEQDSIDSMVSSNRASE